MSGTTGFWSCFGCECFKSSLSRAERWILVPTVEAVVVPVVVILTELRALGFRGEMCRGGATVPVWDGATAKDIES
jgi:hypothetical protein